ncbi:hypothetical protein FOPG_17765 [Fusarium oxysporum f. sp. conglutinans race 2 54008]|uniref:Uncharacterized protein n=2 Tax=Fusarium oxysporum TaxID=5507 RepID=X0KXL1_FUSOX|nr:hypothetical protein FOPG_17765 [Fusarium oxysporum f. sp. conglutinans race 2 54008]EXM13532.1 hypothetical protein FOTG_18023 [Fusarium oxysporum f. sp. vasinfectum 25433]
MAIALSRIRWRRCKLRADEKETTVDWELDPDKITEARKNIPLNMQPRFDVYPDVGEGKIQFEEP